MKRAWLDADYDVCATLLREGKSAREIAAIIGRSVGAVVGMVRRTPRLAEIGFANPSPIIRLPGGTLVARRLNRQIIGLATVRKERMATR